MDIKALTADIGWIVGRFQVPDLHVAHIDLINSVIKRHSKVVVTLGISCVNDEKDPLDFEARKQMILEKFPNVIVVPLHDCMEDLVWSHKLDDLIRAIANPMQSVLLYGSRDSFIKHYKGRYQCIELEQNHWISGTELREYAKNNVIPNSSFRSGATWNAWQKYASVHPTVDIGIVDYPKNKILFGRKKDEPKWRFIGGFVDPTDENFEAAANRELREELPDIECEIIYRHNYIGSFSIDDWRYRGRRNKVKTLLYLTNYVFGAAIPGDDIAEAKWFDMDDPSLRNEIQKEHLCLFDAVMTWVNLSKSKKQPEAR